MPRDSLMGPRDVDRMLEAAKAQEVRRQQEHQNLVRELKLTLEQPHKILRLNTTLCGLTTEGELKVLHIATPGGERFDVPLSSVALANIARAVGEIEGQEAA